MKKYILLLFLGITGTLSAQKIELAVPGVKQEQTNWCVAASTKCVLDYNEIIKNQCEIMQYVRDVTGYNNKCCNSPQSCNVGAPFGYISEKGSALDILQHFGLPVLISPKPSLIGEIRGGLEIERPKIIHLEYYLFPSHHAAVIYGIEDDCIGIMDPLDGIKDWFDYNLVLDNGGRRWLGTLSSKSCSSRGNNHCCNGVCDSDLGEEGVDCGAVCGVPCDGGTTPEDHCKNHRRDPDLGETGIDCGGKDCPECTLCNNCILDPGEDAMDCGGTCPPCKYMGGITDEVTITKTAQLTSVVKAFNKITAGGATTVASGKEVNFITEPTGSIVLLPGFKAESGSKFKTQRKDLNKRFCGAICYDYTLPDHLTKPPEELYIYNLRYAVEFRYDIYEDKERIYSNYFYISRDEDFKLWDCLADIYDASNVPRGRHYYKMKYTIYYCNGAAHLYSKEHDFYVDYDYETLSKDFEDSEDINTHQSSSSDHLKIQDKKNAPSLSILPNPNPGTFQLETNFPLSAIGNLKITNLMGATVYETQNVASNMVQLQNPAAGTFFVVMILKDGAVLTQKMVIQK